MKYLLLPGYVSLVHIFSLLHDSRKARKSWPAERLLTAFLPLPNTLPGPCEGLGTYWFHLYMCIISESVFFSFYCGQEKMAAAVPACVWYMETTVISKRLKSPLSTGQGISEEGRHLGHAFFIAADFK